MEHRRIGELEASVVGLGCNNFGMRIDADQTKAVVDAAIDAGINYFDTAEGYGNGLSEEFLGAALKGRRDQVLVATKWGMLPTDDDVPPTGSAEAVRTAVEASLSRLGTDYIDHYQYHRPDGRTPVAETLGALAELVAEGKVREIGCSNFSAAQLDEAEKISAEAGIPRFVTVQNHYSLLTRDPEDDGVLDACGRLGIGFVPFFPLESGVLTGKYTFGEAAPEGTRLASMGERAERFLNDERAPRVAAMKAWADAKGHSLLDAAIGWLLSDERVTSVISGATKPEQVQANAAAGAWIMTAEERAELGSR